MPSHDNPKTRRFPFVPNARQQSVTLFGTLVVFLWYAIPDFITEKKARFFTRLAALGGLAGVFAAITKNTVNEVRRDFTMESPDEEAWEMNSNTVQLTRDNLNVPMLVLLFSFGGAIITGSIWIETWLFRRGERRRREGVRFAHTRQAIPLGLLFGAVNLLDDSASRQVS
ncbi:hypothetical protein HHJ78_06205 [Mobiluncus mulieris]|uniref:Uncharacterized protein n=1 Tax=Mobiluncus mulieris TaxID=2052 RepID=A0A7Y0U1B1_9ACTO|nr:hypothetical protein [Mobiluncus mulieris]NMW62650.1 hypothetical protein [Mobiluncus mulieris]NMW65129.1 hypothetical protein [Mobiluncus mulieris]